MFKIGKTTKPVDEALIHAIHAEAKKKYPDDKILREYHEFVKWIQSDLRLTHDMASRMSNPPDCMLKVLQGNQGKAVLWSKETRPEMITSLLCRDLYSCVYASLLPGASQAMKEITRKRLEMHLIEGQELKDETKELDLDFEDASYHLEEIIKGIVRKCAERLEPSIMEELEEVAQNALVGTGRLMYASASGDLQVREATPRIMEDVRKNVNHLVKRLSEAYTRQDIEDAYEKSKCDNVTLDSLLESINEIIRKN